jgi:hypothetical protein
MSDEQTVYAEVPLAREAYRRGVPPSQIVSALMRRGWSQIMLVLLGREAFALTIAECKGAEGITYGSIEPPIFDAYVIPLIERNRPMWDG